MVAPAKHLTCWSLAADAIRKTIKKVMNCRKITINLKRHGFCGQVQQMVYAPVLRAVAEQFLEPFQEGEVFRERVCRRSLST